MGIEEASTQHFCAGDLLITYLSEHDTLFEQDLEARKGYLLINGLLRYDLKPTALLPFGEQEGTWQVEHLAWLCEAAFWTHWTHVGIAKALVACEVMSFSTR